MNVTLTIEARAQLEDLTLAVQRRIGALLRRLADWPAVSGAKPLRGELAGQFRLRTGDYRVQFHVRGREVVVTRIGHRDGFYDEN